MTFKWAPVLRRYLRVWRESNFSFFPCVRALGKRGGEGAANEKNGTRLAPNIYVYARLLIFSVQSRAERVQASELQVAQAFSGTTPPTIRVQCRAVVYGRASCTTPPYSCNMEIGSSGCGANRVTDLPTVKFKIVKLRERGIFRSMFRMMGFSFSWFLEEKLNVE